MNLAYLKEIVASAEKMGLHDTTPVVVGVESGPDHSDRRRSVGRGFVYKRPISRIHINLERGASIIIET